MPLRNIRIEAPTNAGLIYIDGNNITVENVVLENITVKTLHSYGNPEQGEGVISETNGGMVFGVHFKCVFFDDSIMNSLADAHIHTIGTIDSVDFDNSGCASTAVQEISSKASSLPVRLSGNQLLFATDGIRTCELFGINGRKLFSQKISGRSFVIPANMNGVIIGRVVFTNKTETIKITRQNSK